MKRRRMEKRRKRPHCFSYTGLEVRCSNIQPCGKEEGCRIRKPKVPGSLKTYLVSGQRPKEKTVEKKNSYTFLRQGENPRKERYTTLW